MVTYLNIELSEKEEKFLTSVIISMANGEKISDADILHKLIQMAESDYKLNNAKRILRKGVANIKRDKHHCKDLEFANGTYAKGFLNCAELLKEIID